MKILHALTGLWLTTFSLAAEHINFEVRETAGIRRFHYPVSATLTLHRLARVAVPTAGFRLLAAGKPIPTQFTPGDGSSRSTTRLTVDFNDNFGPGEVRHYTLDYGEDVTDIPAVTAGMAARLVDGGVVVDGASKEYMVPSDLRGLLRTAKMYGKDYLVDDSPGLVIRTRDGRTHRIGVHRARGRTVAIRRGGPLVCEVVVTGEELLDDVRALASRVSLVFPASKSWVQVSWTVDDPDDVVESIGAGLHCLITGRPTLVDFGAGTLVYTKLDDGQIATLVAPPPPSPWKVLRGTIGRLESLVEAPAPGAAAQTPPEGWAHVMDRERCAALAVDAFAQDARDQITVAANGQVAIERRFPSGRRQKSVTFWIHVVSFPPQISATTSPQSMMSPLAVRSMAGGQ